MGTEKFEQDKDRAHDMANVSDKVHSNATYYKKIDRSDMQEASLNIAEEKEQLAGVIHDLQKLLNYEPMDFYEKRINRPTQRELDMLKSLVGILLRREE